VAAVIEKFLNRVEGERYAAPGAAIVRGHEARVTVARVESILTQRFGEDSEFADRVRRLLAQSGLETRQRLQEEVRARAAGAVVKFLNRDAASMVAAAQDAYALAARNLTAEAVDTLRGIVTREFVQGGSVAGLRRRLTDEGFIPDLKVGKRTLRAEARAAMMARTESKRISTKTYMELAEGVEPDRGERFYRWISTLGQNVGDDSVRRHGLVLSEKDWMTHDFGDGLFGLPPIRPNDRCTAVFVREKWMTEKERKAAKADPGSEDSRLIQEGDVKLFQLRRDAMDAREERRRS
jgi:hypothetical protein